MLQSSSTSQPTLPWYYQIVDNDDDNDDIDETYKSHKQHVKEEPMNDHYNHHQHHYATGPRWYEREEYNIDHGVVTDDILEAYIEQMSSDGMSKDKTTVSDNEKRNGNYDETFKLQKHHVKEEPIDDHNNHYQQHYDTSLRWYERYEYNDGIITDDILEAYIKEMSNNGMSKNKNTVTNNEKRNGTHDHYHCDKSTVTDDDMLSAYYHKKTAQNHHDESIVTDDMLYAYYYQETSRKAAIMSNETTITSVTPENDDHRNEMSPLASSHDDERVVETSIMKWLCCCVGGLMTLSIGILLMRKFFSSRRRSGETGCINLTCSNTQKKRGKRKKRRRKNKDRCQESVEETKDVSSKEEDSQTARDDALIVNNDIDHHEQKRQKRNEDQCQEGVRENKSTIPNEEESQVARDDAIMETSDDSNQHNHSHEAFSKDNDELVVVATLRHQSQANHHSQPINNNSTINVPPPDPIITPLNQPNDNPPTILTNTNNSNNSDYLSTVRSLSHALSMTGLDDKTSLQIAHESLLRRMESERTLSLWHELEKSRNEHMMNYITAMTPQQTQGMMMLDNGNNYETEWGLVRIWWQWSRWCVFVALGGRVGLSCYGVYRDEGLWGCVLFFIEEICQCHNEDTMVISSTISSPSTTTISMAFNFLSSLLPSQSPSSSTLSRMIDATYCYTSCLSKHLAGLMVVYLTHRLFESFKCHDMFHHVVNILAVGSFVMSSFRQVALWEIVAPVVLVNGVAAVSMMSCKVMLMKVLAKGKEQKSGDDDRTAAEAVESTPLKMTLSTKRVMWKMEVVLKLLSLVTSLVMGMGVEALKMMLYGIIL